MTELSASSLLSETAKLRADVDNIKVNQSDQSDRINKLCDKLEPILTSINDTSNKMQMYMEKEKEDHDLISEMANDITKILHKQDVQEDKIINHAVKIEAFDRISQFIKYTKIILVSGFLVISSILVVWYKYDQHDDRNRKHEIEMKKLDLETIKLNSEMDQKKKHDDYLKYKYTLNHNLKEEKLKSGILIDENI